MQPSQKKTNLLFKALKKTRRANYHVLVRSPCGQAINAPMGTCALDVDSGGQQKDADHALTHNHYTLINNLTTLHAARPDTYNRMPAAQ